MIYFLCLCVWIHDNLRTKIRRKFILILKCLYLYFQAGLPLEATTRYAMQRYNESSMCICMRARPLEEGQQRDIASCRAAQQKIQFRLFFPPVKRDKMEDDNLINSVFERKYLWEKKEPLYDMRILTMKLWNNFNLLPSS